MKSVLFIAIFTPLIGALFIYWLSLFYEMLSNVAATLICGLTFVFTACLYPAVGQGRIIEVAWQIGTIPALFSFRADALGIFMALVSSLIWTISSWYAIEYLMNDKHKARYQCFSLFSLSGIMGIVLGGNMLTLYFFFEIMAILSYMLIVHDESAFSLAAGSKYLFMGIIGGIILLLSIILTRNITGTFDFTNGGYAVLRSSPYFLFLFWGFIIGFAVKAGIFPLHIWRPYAYPAAPCPATALLSAVMVKAGAFGIIKTVYGIFGAGRINTPATGKILLIISIITIILGSGLAIAQKEIKRMLAYSSMSQIGYVILGVILLSGKGLAGGIYHIMAHALAKTVLFLCAGAIIYKTGIREIKDMKGIGQKMPLTMLCFTLAALSMVGFPPFVGFVSKWILGVGALQAASMNVISQTTGIVIIGVLILSSLLTAVYYGPIVMDGWFGSCPQDPHDHHPLPDMAVQRCDPSWIMIVPIFVLVISMIVFAIYAQWPMRLIGLAVNQIL
ncbi:MAG: proton-conducting transporter membrane subunit [bacterium]